MLRNNDNKYKGFKAKDLINPQYFIVPAETKVKILNKEAEIKLNKIFNNNRG